MIQRLMNSITNYQKIIRSKFDIYLRFGENDGQEAFKKIDLGMKDM